MTVDVCPRSAGESLKDSPQESRSTPRIVPRRRFKMPDPALNQGDGIHPNEEGAAIVAARVRDALEPLLPALVP